MSDLEAFGIGLGVLGVVLAAGAIGLALWLYAKTTKQIRRLAIVVFGAANQVLRALPVDTAPHPLEEEYDADDYDFTFQATVSKQFLEPEESVVIGLVVMDANYYGGIHCTVMTPAGGRYRSEELVPEAFGEIKFTFPSDFKDASTEPAGLYHVHWTTSWTEVSGDKERTRYFPASDNWFVVLP